AAELIGRLPVEGTFVTIQERQEFGGQQKDVNLVTVKERQQEFLEYFAGMIGRLRGMAEKELRQERLNDDDIRFLDRLIQSTRANGAGGPRRYDGWYTRMFYQS